MTLAIQAPREPSLLPVAEMDRAIALVVEDDPDTRTWMVAILRGAGWRVLHAPDGERALMQAREHVPDVILLDLVLPRMSGLDVLRELRSPRWADQPTTVVVVSSFASLMRLPDLRLADAVVQKPFMPSALLDHVEAARARSRGPVFG